MAHVNIPSDDELVRKSKQNSRFTNDKDLIIVQEVAAAKAHLAAFGQSEKHFEGAANKANANATMSEKVV